MSELMSELEAVRESLAELEGLDKPTLLRSLMSAHLEMLQLEKNNEAQQHNCRVTSQQADLYARRCDLAVAICCNTEDGLSRDKLDQIATIIWPAPKDPLSVPSSQATPLTHAQLTTHICNAEFLLGRADALLTVLKNALPDGFTTGAHFLANLTEWRKAVDSWRAGYRETKQHS